LRLRWTLRVKGHRLRHGRYRITLRALDRKHNVIGTTRSAVVVVR
jgi:hypothetical protein